MNSYNSSSSFLIIITILSLLSAFLGKSQKGFITEEFTMVTKNNYMIALVSLGTPNQEVNLVLDTGSMRTWVSKELFNYKASSTFHTENFVENFKQDEFSYSGFCADDKISFGDTSLMNFDFDVVNKISGKNDISGVLSLGREYDSKKFSVVYRFSGSEKTFFNAFCLEFDPENHLKGKLYIGDLTEKMQEQTDLMDKCKLADTKSIRWSCQLTHLFIGELGAPSTQRKNKKVYSITKENQNTMLPVGLSASFETLFNKIVFPINDDKYINYIENKYLVNKKGDKICQKITGDRTTFECSEEEVKELKNLNFGFGDLDLYLEPQDLFSCIDTKCEMLIETNKEVNRMIIGSSLFRKYITYFDYNSEYLNFYGKTNKALIKFEIDEGKSFFSRLAVFFLVVLIILLVGFIAFYLHRRRNALKKKKLEEEIYQKF